MSESGRRIGARRSNFRDFLNGIWIVFCHRVCATLREIPSCRRRFFEVKQNVDDATAVSNTLFTSQTSDLTARSFHTARFCVYVCVCASANNCIARVNVHSAVPHARCSRLCARRCIIWNAQTPANYPRRGGEKEKLSGNHSEHILSASVWHRFAEILRGKKKLARPLQ